MDRGHASVLAITAAGAVCAQAIPPAHAGPRQQTDTRRYALAAGAGLVIGGALAVAADDPAPLVIAAALVAGTIALREYLIGAR